MQAGFDFSDLQPYRDEDVAAAVAELRHSRPLITALGSIFPQRDFSLEQLGKAPIESLAGFQARVMKPAIQFVIEHTVDALTSAGFDQLDGNNRHLYISNHRDIFLDSALLAWFTYQHWGTTMEMAIGDNLVSQPWMRQLFRLNKTVIVARDLPPRALLHASRKLSAYIHQLVGEGHDSFWIAQREGRAKDGNDRTQSGLVKMLTLAGGKKWDAAFCALNPVPVSISYEFDPCDLVKARERLNIQRHGEHHKVPGEDFMSIATGIRGHKGRVHVALGRPLAPIWSEIVGEGTSNERLEQLRVALDREIQGHYHLWPGNYLAYDLCQGARRFQDQYSEADVARFEARLTRRLAGETDADALRALILEMYANPVRNQLC